MSHPSHLIHWGMGIVVGLGLLGACQSTSKASDPPPSSSTSNAPQDEMSDPLEPLAWEKRPVVLFASRADQETYREQLDNLREHASGVEERHIAIFRVVGLGEERELSGQGPDGALEASEAQALVERFEPDRPFTFVLVGKDTGEKLRSRDLVSIDKLFGTIDAMPMRQREMDEQQNDDAP